MTENHESPAGNQPPQYGSNPSGGQPQYQGGDAGNGHGPLQNQGGDLAAPKAVNTAARLIYISAAISLISLIISPFVLMGTDEYKSLQDQGQGGYAWGILAVGAVFSLILIVLQVLSARAATRGKNWRRIVLLILAILSLLGLGGAFQDAPGIIGAIGTILLIIGTIMLWVGESGRWFKELKQRRNPMNR
ncbi:MAG: hypothetical protein L0G46_07810 [Kocuria sp.]|nr:hypothetical protein [Kocuria sp.]